MPNATARKTLIIARRIPIGPSNERPLAARFGASGRLGIRFISRSPLVANRRAASCTSCGAAFQHGVCLGSRLLHLHEPFSTGLTRLLVWAEIA
jgi:hypothetical protein